MKIVKIMSDDIVYQASVDQISDCQTEEFSLYLLVNIK